MESGIARQREFHGRAAEGTTRDLGIGVLHRAVQQRARPLLGVRVLVVGPRQCPPDLRGRVVLQRGFELLAHQRGLGLDVESGEHESSRVAETADGSPSAHFEHTIAVTSNGPLILTRPKDVTGPSW